MRIRLRTIQRRANFTFGDMQKVTDILPGISTISLLFILKQKP